MSQPSPLPPVQPDRREQRHRERRWGFWSPEIWGILIVIVGVYYLLKNFGVLNWLHDDALWPILLIVVGLTFIFRRSRRL